MKLSPVNTDEVRNLVWHQMWEYVWSGSLEGIEVKAWSRVMREIDNQISDDIVSNGTISDSLLR
jgi:hypothetical protein